MSHMVNGDLILRFPEPPCRAALSVQDDHITYPLNLAIR